MNPDLEVEEVESALTILSETMAVDSVGEVFFKGADGEWSSLADMTIDAEKSRDKYIRETFKDGLVNEGDMVYVRLIGGRLVWIKQRVGGGETWQELTPEIAKRGGIAPVVQQGKSAVESLAEAMLVQEPESYEIGWYQDVKGDLYQFDGKTWVGKTPSQKEKDALEFLG